MDGKRFFLTALATYVVFQITTFLIHGVLLMPDYTALQNVWRPDMMSKLWLMRVLDIPTTLILTYIFIKGYEHKGLMEGVRFGLWLGVLLWIGGAWASWITFPITFALAMKWFVFGILQMILVGITMAVVYKPKTGHAQ